MKKALVIGFGVSGKASAALLQSQGWKVMAVDQDKKVFDQAPSCVEGFEEGEKISLNEVSLVVLSPGIPPSHPLIQQATSEKIEIVGEVDLAFRFLSNRCIGVTGTNGKTTVTLLVTHLLKTVGLAAQALGNVGTPLSCYAIAPKTDEILVIELSSFQLETLKQKKLDAAIFLNLTPDHLDRYASLRDYAAAKAKIQECLKPEKKLYVSDQVYKDYKTLFDPEKIAFFEEVVAPISPLKYTESESRIGIWQGGTLNLKQVKPAPKQPMCKHMGDAGGLKFSGCPTKSEPILDSRAVCIQWGVPESQNVQAAFAVCSEFGLSNAQMQEGLKSFRKPPHRIEWVAEIDGVHYYDDSKGTNIDAVIHAMALFEGPVILIVGGVDKGASYYPWAEAFKGKVRQMIAYGQAAEKMNRELSPFFPLKRVERFADAVKMAKLEARKGEKVLLSPGCSSFDQHRNYAHRGDEFKQLVLG